MNITHICENCNRNLTKHDVQTSEAMSPRCSFCESFELIAFETYQKNEQMVISAMEAENRLNQPIQYLTLDINRLLLAKTIVKRIAQNEFWRGEAVAIKDVLQAAKLFSDFNEQITHLDKVLGLLEAPGEQLRLIEGKYL